jgi:hypothetical protein
VSLRCCPGAGSYFLVATLGAPSSEAAVMMVAMIDLSETKAQDPALVALLWSVRRRADRFA